MWKAQDGDEPRAMVRPHLQGTELHLLWTVLTTGSPISRTATPLSKLNTRAMEEMLNMETCPLLKSKLRSLLLYEFISK